MMPGPAFQKTVGPGQTGPREAAAPVDRSEAGVSTPEDRYTPDREKPVTVHGLVMWQAGEKVPLEERSEARASTP